MLFFSALLNTPQNIEHLHYSKLVEGALDMLPKMRSSNINPDATTACIFVEALSKCQPHKLDKVPILLHAFKNHTSPVTNSKLATTLIRSYARVGDSDGVHTTFENLRKKDIISFNAYLDMYARIGEADLALKIFKNFFLPNNSNGNDATHEILPDVITFTTLIAGLIKMEDAASAKQATILYEHMRDVWNIMPDTRLVDVFFSAILSKRSARPFEDIDTKFTSRLMRDASKLHWPEGEYERRETRVRGAIGDILRERMFRKKNWNSIDSGFRPWGKSNDKKSDEFLARKGWNDVNSGFRIF